MAQSQEQKESALFPKKWRLRENERVVVKEKILRAYANMLFPKGSLQDLCAFHTGDWQCGLEIDYFHAQVNIESLPTILGVYTTIGGPPIRCNRNFPVMFHDRGTAKACAHLDVVCQRPFLLKVYFHKAAHVEMAKEIIGQVYKKNRCHFVGLDSTSNRLCIKQLMARTNILVDALVRVKAAVRSCQVFLNQFGGKHPWLDFQKRFRNVFIPNPYNLWDLTITMRHKLRHIIMFRRNEFAGNVAALMHDCSH